MKNSQSLHRDSSEPNLTLISVYSPNTSPTVRVNVKRSSSSSETAASPKSSQFFSLFKLPKRRNITASASNGEILQRIDGILSDDNINKNETIVQASKKEKEKYNRFIKFLRYFFCRFLPITSNATVTPTIEYQTTDNTNDSNHQDSENNTIGQVDDHSKVKLKNFANIDL